jgi:hypothetical protein
MNCFVNSRAQESAIRENISSFASKWVKLALYFKNLRLKETKLNLTKNKTSESKKAKGS